MQAALSARHPGRIPHRGFQQHVGGIGAHFGGCRTHHAADRGGRHLVDDENIGRIQFALNVIEGADGLTGPGKAHAKATGDAIAVVGVHGVTQFQHHVVGHVHGRRSGADAG